MAVDEVRNVSTMRCLGFFLLILCVAEFIIGGVVYAWITNVHVGAWWAAVTPCIAAICAMYSYSHCAVVTGCIFSILGTISAMVGAIVDGISAQVFNGETTCGNVDTGKFYGDSGGQKDVGMCALAYFQDSTGRIINFFPDDDHPYTTMTDDVVAKFSWDFNCMCTDGALCYEYNLRHGNDCGQILTTYTYLLCISTALCVMICVTTFVYSIFTCVSCCCNHHPDPHPPVHEMHPQGHYYSKTRNDYA